MKKLVFVMLLYISMIPLIGAAGFAWGYFNSMGVEMYYYNNPVDDTSAEQISDYSEPANAEYLM